MKKITPLSIGKQNAYAPPDFIFVSIDVQFVPTILQAIEPRKLRFAYETEEEWVLCYSALCQLQVALLMDATDRIVSEIRALRAGVMTPPEALDPLLDPFTLDLPAIGDVNQNVITVNDSVLLTKDDIVNKLQGVIDALNAQGTEETLAPILTDILGALIVLI
jgi:hypothetical protein